MDGYSTEEEEAHIFYAFERHRRSSGTAEMSILPRMLNHIQYFGEFQLGTLPVIPRTHM